MKKELIDKLNLIASEEKFLSGTSFVASSAYPERFSCILADPDEPDDEGASALFEVDDPETGEGVRLIEVCCASPDYDADETNYCARFGFYAALKLDDPEAAAEFKAECEKQGWTAPISFYG